jgi:hypothetical protein
MAIPKGLHATALHLTGQSAALPDNCLGGAFMNTSTKYRKIQTVDRTPERFEGIDFNYYIYHQRRPVGPSTISPLVNSWKITNASMT